MSGYSAMFRTLRRLLLPNPFDSMLKACARRGGKKVLLRWNRGLGDIALGLYAMIQRIREIIPDAEISFLTRPNLRDGFSLLRDIRVLIDPDLKRGEKSYLHRSLQKIGIDPKSFDLLIENPSPTDWVPWQRGKVTPRLQSNVLNEKEFEKFDLPSGFIYVAVQAIVETNYGSWRNWPLAYWEQLFSRLEQFPRVKVILFGSDDKTEFTGRNLIDLRGKTSLYEMLSIVRFRCHHIILPDSGILSMVYYLDHQFPIHVISLWADPNHGILKQAVASPNLQLVHHPLIGTSRDLSTVSVDQMMNTLFPIKPVTHCPHSKDVALGSLEKVGCIVLAGGQGTRLGAQGPKGLFSIQGKTLFEWICEKTPEKEFPIAIMTSPSNHEETVRFFASKNHFGREIYFFMQETLPVLNEKKRLMNGEQVPNGNGSVFRSFCASGLADVFTKKGIDLLTIVPIENPLADPTDLSLIGHTRDALSDVTIKCVPRESQSESMGVLVEREGRIEIIEYTDLDPRIEYRYSNTGMMAISLPFFQEMARQDLPLHWVRKIIPGTSTLGWKGEKFIFDALPFGKVSALCYEKKSCYAPLKNQDSVSSCKRLLIEKMGSIPV